MKLHNTINPFICTVPGCFKRQADIRTLELHGLTHNEEANDSEEGIFEEHPAHEMSKINGIENLSEAAINYVNHLYYRMKTFENGKRAVEQKKVDREESAPGKKKKKEKKTKEEKESKDEEYIPKEEDDWSA